MRETNMGSLITFTFHFSRFTHHVSRITFHYGNAFRIWAAAPRE